MTDLNKRIARRTIKTVFEKGHRRVVVTLEPGDMLGLRLERTRETYYVSLTDLFQETQTRTIIGRARKIEARAKQIAKGGVNLRTARKQARQESKCAS